MYLYLEELRQLYDKFGCNHGTVGSTLKLFIYINNLILETEPLCVTLQTKLQKLQSPNLARVCYIAWG